MWPVALSAPAVNAAPTGSGPDVKERIEKTGLSAAYLDDTKFGAVVRADHERFGKIIRDAGIKPN